VFALIFGLSPFLSWATEPDADRQGVRWGVIPIANYSSDRGLQVGALAQRFDYGSRDLRPFETLWTIQASTSTQGPKDLAAEYESILEDGRLSLTVALQENSQFPYYGTGAKSAFVTPSDLYQREIEVGGSIAQNWGPHSRATVRVELLSTRYEERGIDTPYFKDYGSGPRARFQVPITLSAVRDTRDSEFIPTRGERLEAAFSLAPDAWSRLALDARKVWPLLPERSLVGALQLRHISASSETPLTRRARLGSWTSLRGLPYNRFMGSHATSLRAEVRSVLLRTRLFDLPLKGGLSLFTDHGILGNTWKEWAGGPVRSSWGISLTGSYFTDDFIGVAEVAFSGGSSASYLQLGYAF
jgi:outer membrane protein assembly factor BamA